MFQPFMTRAGTGWCADSLYASHSDEGAGDRGRMSSSRRHGPAGDEATLYR